MPFQQNTPINMPTVRSYDIFIPPTPRSALLPTIIIFHSGGQDIRTIEKRWGIEWIVGISGICSVLGSAVFLSLSCGVGWTDCPTLMICGGSTGRSRRATRAPARAARRPARATSRPGGGTGGARGGARRVRPSCGLVVRRGRAQQVRRNQLRRAGSSGREPG